MSLDARVSFGLFAANPPGLVHAGIAIAAARAGHVGFLNLDFARLDAPSTRAAVALVRRTLGQGCKGGWGLKLQQSDLAGLDDLLGDLAPDWLLVVPDDLKTLGKTWADLRARWPECRLLVELREAQGLASAVKRIAEAGAQGIVAKGFEAGGQVGTETTFLMVQRLRALTDLPIIAHGGVAPDTAAALATAGAGGVLLDWQLALFDAAATPPRLAKALRGMDGSETRCLGLDLGLTVRSYWRADHAPAKALDVLERELNGGKQPEPRKRAAFVAALSEAVSAEDPDAALWLVGQDAAFAARFRDGHARLDAALDALAEAVPAQLAEAARLQPLAEGAPLAEALGTRYPIVQGPMTRVSDRAEFALAVADGGALPFLALALMRGPEAGVLVEETKALLGDRPGASASWALSTTRCALNKRR